MPNALAPTYEATLYYSESLLRRVVFAFWRRTVGIGFPLALLVLTALLALGASLYGMNWYLSFLAAIVCLGSLLVAIIFVTHYRHTMARFRHLKSPWATLRVNREQLIVTSDLGRSEIDWRVVSEIWRFPDFWLLLFSKAQFMTVPLEGLSAEMQHFIREQVQLAGGKVH